MADTYENVTPRPVVGRSATGELAEMTEITFTTKPHGLAGKVRIVGNPPDLDLVRQVLSDKSAEIEAIANL